MAQLLTPVSDQATGSWTNPPLWSKANVDDGTDAISEAVGNNTQTSNADLKLASGSDPQAGTETLRVRWHHDQNGRSMQATCELYQGDPAAGGSLITTLQSASNVGTTEVEDSTTVSGVTDYSDLYVRLYGFSNGGGPSRSLHVDLVEFEIPDASASNPVDVDPPAGVGIGKSFAVAAAIVLSIQGPAAPAVGVAPVPDVSTTAGNSVTVDPPAGVAVGVSTLRVATAQANITVGADSGFAVGVATPSDVSASIVTSIASPPAVAVATAKPPDVTATADVAVAPASGLAVGVASSSDVSAADSVSIDPPPGVAVGAASRTGVASTAVVDIDPPPGVTVGVAAPSTLTQGTTVESVTSPAVGVGFTPAATVDVSIMPRPGVAVAVTRPPVLQKERIVEAVPAMAVGVSSLHSIQDVVTAAPSTCVAVGVATPPTVETASATVTPVAAFVVALAAVPDVSVFEGVVHIDGPAFVVVADPGAAAATFADRGFATVVLEESEGDA